VVQDREVALMLVQALSMVSMCQGQWTKSKGVAQGWKMRGKGGADVASGEGGRRVELEQIGGDFLGAETTDNALMADAIV